MPRIFDNIELEFLDVLRDTLKQSKSADFCVGYFNLRGWQKIDDLIAQFAGGEGACCRLLIGMQKSPQDMLKKSLEFGYKTPEGMDNRLANILKKEVAQEFCQQLTWGAPSNQDERALQQLRRQIQEQKLQVKLFLAYPLHGKLYLLHRTDRNNPITGFLGSSNLTLAGLQKQGELNIDVLDHDACEKLQKWFNDRWQDRWCVDISAEIIQIIDQSWARETLIPPYYIYLKMAYHLSQEARSGLAEFKIPPQLDRQLFEYQKIAVKIAARHVTRRGGVMLGDVVGLGKTLMATAIARILQEELLVETLIICPKNLVSMWQNYVDEYRLYGKVVPVSMVQQTLPGLRRYQLVVIDESHNLRNRQGKRYQAIQEYIALNESRCILLTATPYNKTPLDLSNQLRLFIPEDQPLGISPKKLLQAMGGEAEFRQKYQVPPHSLAAFEQSEYADDWQELMRLYLLRRTRSFIQKNYAKIDDNGRRYLEFADGSRSYFPLRQPRTIKFNFGGENDPYCLLYSEDVVTLLNRLNLPRYGLANYQVSKPKATPAELQQLKNISRSGKKQLMGFCRTNLFKRLESSGPAFLQSIDRHILRNYIFLYAIAKDLPLPIGTLDPTFLDSDIDLDEALDYNIDNDGESGDNLEDNLEENLEGDLKDNLDTSSVKSLEKQYRDRAAQVYQLYREKYSRRFKWLRPQLFKTNLKKDLRSDGLALIELRQNFGQWIPEKDQKLNALLKLICQDHPQEKVLIFTQFADTVAYLAKELEKRGISQVGSVTGKSKDPAKIAQQFSPHSNHKSIPPEAELRILIATDVLSEGLNLQDAAIIVNYDLPWAIIRLIQRAGRVDRIGQTAAKILCYSFLPAEGLEKIIRLRSRLRQRLQENAEVVGTDEVFFEEDMGRDMMVDLYHEKSDIFETEEDGEVDLTSEAYQIWKNAIDADPSLQQKIETLPNVVFSTRPHQGTTTHPEGVILYMRTAEGNDSLAWIDLPGNSVTQSQLAILRTAACHPKTPAIPHHPEHHELVQKGADLIEAEEKTLGGQLGRPSGVRFRTYERLKQYIQTEKGTLFVTEDLHKAANLIYNHPLRQSAIERLNRVLKLGVSDREFAELVVSLYLDDRLCLINQDAAVHQSQIICSLGLFTPIK